VGNIVAIVGRPNVGKSTLYNRFIGGRDAIVDDQSGVTRDRRYGVAEWNGKKFTVVDTGGFVRGSEDIFESAIRTQVEIAIEEATVLVFLVDVATGITDLDDQVADMLRRTKKDVFLVVNKVDNHQRLLEATEFYSMGFENIFFMSSMSGSGSGELLDAITDKIENFIPLDTDLPKFAIVGQPNVGKSSLTNALLGIERNIVTDIAGTTRDPTHSHYNKFDKEFILVDTAGIRRKAKVHEDLEFYSVMRAINALEECDVCLLMVDAQTGMENQDMAIFKLAKDRNKGIILLINKWDLITKDTNTAKEFEEKLRERISPFRDIPVIFISVLEKQRISKAIDLAIEVNENRKRRIKTSVLNDWLEAAIAKVEPPSHRGVFVKIKYVTQLPLHYPCFAFFCNHPKFVTESYQNYLENQLRANFNFHGVPITFVFKEK
jgi:GTPase